MPCVSRKNVKQIDRLKTGFWDKIQKSKSSKKSFAKVFVWLNAPKNLKWDPFGPIKRFGENCRSAETTSKGGFYGFDELWNSYRIAKRSFDSILDWKMWPVNSFLNRIATNSDFGSIFLAQIFKLEKSLQIELYKQLFIEFDL